MQLEKKKKKKKKGSTVFQALFSEKEQKAGCNLMTWECSNYFYEGLPCPFVICG
jgi:hypothetical protein